MYNLSVITSRAIFKEHFSVTASVSEYLLLRILENVPKLSKVLAVMQNYKKRSMVKHFLREVLTLTIYHQISKNLIVKLKAHSQA